MRNSIIVFVLCLSLCGCASLVAKPPQVVLLPEERIFTVPAGQTIKVELDERPMDITFPEDMKLVSSTVLLRQEEKLNNALLDKIKASAGKSKILLIVGSILGIIGGIVGIFFGKNFWPKISVKAETK